MAITEPDQWDAYYDLMPTGRIYFGRASRSKGVHVDSPAIIAKLEGLEPYYPNSPFAITSHRSMLMINKALERSRGTIPDWLRADCFEYFWKESQK